jgi:hypothetical protein
VPSSTGEVAASTHWPVALFTTLYAPLAATEPPAPPPDIEVSWNDCAAVPSHARCSSGRPDEPAEGTETHLPLWRATKWYEPPSSATGWNCWFGAAPPAARAVSRNARAAARSPSLKTFNHSRSRPSAGVTGACANATADATTNGTIRAFVFIQIVDLLNGTRAAPKPLGRRARPIGRQGSRSSRRV